MKGQVIDYEAMEKGLATIQISSEATKSSLNNMNELIQSSVGEAGGAWSGESARAFRASWDELAAKIPEYITIVQNQVQNLQNMLEITKEADTTKNGSVSE